MNAAQPDLASAYARYFRVVPAVSAELLREVYRIRYEVYCEELGFEDQERFPDRLERDEFDASARHCLLMHRPTETFIGCVRLVMAGGSQPEAAFPFERVAGPALRRDVMNPATMDRAKFGEISRLAVRRSFRRRAGEQSTPDGLAVSRMAGESAARERRQLPPIALGLYLAAAGVGLQAGLTSVFAMMEPRLARHMRFYGLEFEQVSDVVIHRGARAVYNISRARLFDRMSRPLAGLLELITAELESVPPAKP